MVLLNRAHAAVDPSASVSALLGRFGKYYILLRRPDEPWEPFIVPPKTECELEKAIHIMVTGLDRTTFVDISFH